MKFSFWNFVSGIYDWTFARSMKKDIPVILEMGEFKLTDAVLDYGGGTGRVAEAIRDRVARVIVADCAQKMLAKAAAKGIATEVVSSLPTRFASGSFDAILVVEALHHMPNHEDHLREFHRLLKSGGTLLLEEPDTNSWARYWLWTDGFFETVRFHSPDELKRLIAARGFSVLRERREGFAYFVQARKVG